MKQISGDLASACAEYRLLLDLGYPGRSSATFVGDRHRLSAEERIILARGVASSKDSLSRRGRLKEAAPSGSVLLIDGYNVLYTLLHYLIGKPLFISSDGFLRDAGAAYGRLVHKERFTECLGLMYARLLALGPSSVFISLDSPVSGSGILAGEMTRRFSELGIPGRAETARSADFALKARGAELACAARKNAEGRHGPEGAKTEAFVASSDSALVDSIELPFLDLARLILEEKFRPDLIDLAPFALAKVEGGTRLMAKP